MFLIITCFAPVLTIFYLNNIYPFLFPEIIIRERFRISSVLKMFIYAGNAIYNSILNCGITRFIFRNLKNL